MVNPNLQKTIINGIDVSSYVLSWAVEEQFNAYFRTAKIVLKRTLNEVLDYTVEDLAEKSVSIQRGSVTSTDEYKFQGFIESVEFEGAKVIFNCEDKLRLSKQKTVNKSYDYQIDASAGVISEIFKDLINTYTGLTASSSSVQNSGTVFIRKKFILRRCLVFDAVKQLAEMLDWQFYYNPVDDLVYFEPKGFQSNSTVIEVGVNTVDVPRWNIDNTNLFNSVTINGVTQNILTVEPTTNGTLLNGVADPEWTTTSVTLNNKPVTTKVYCDTGNPPTTEKRAGVVGASSSYDYSVDKDAKKIIWSITFTPTTSHYARVEYTYELPTPVKRKNNASIALYGKEIEKTLFKDELRDIDDVASFAQKQVDVFGYPFYSTTLNVTGENTLVPGRLYKVVDSLQNVNDTFMITKITYMYPYRYDTIDVGNKELRTADWGSSTIQRIKRLEEKQNDNEDVLQQFIDVEQDLAIRSQLDIYTATPTADTLYWDDLNQGTWDDYNWASDTPETQTLSQRTHSNNIFFEDFWDDDHVDTVNTTATVSTTAHTISFIAGQTFKSDTIYKFKTTNINTAKISIPIASITGSITLYLSNDAGSTFTTATNASTLTFATTGTDLRYRIDSTGTSSITCTNTYGESTPIKLEVNT
jgi:hypothetical protein